MENKLTICIENKHVTSLKCWYVPLFEIHQIYFERIVLLLKKKILLRKLLKDFWFY